MKVKFYTENSRGLSISVPGHIVEDPKFFCVSFPYNKALVEEIKISSEKRQWDARNKEWKLQKTLRNQRLLQHLMGENPFQPYDDELTLSSSDPQTKDMWLHQKKMYAHIIQRKHCIIAGEMRTGKTRPTLAAIDEVCKKYHTDDADTPIFVAPKSALRGLKNELVKWGFAHTIRLLTYEKFRKIFDDCPEIMVPRFIVFDECQKLKNPSSQQGQVARQVTDKQFRKYGFENSYTVLLSGTPSPKEPSNWWNLAEVTFPGFLKEGNVHLLKQELANMEKREGAVGSMYWHLVSWKEDQVERLHRRLSGLVEVFLKKDCLELPQKMYNIITLPVSDMYRQAAVLVSKTDINAAVLLGKLRELSDGFTYKKEYNETTGKEISKAHYFPDCPKDKQFADDLDEFSDVGRVVCYCGFQATLDKLTKIALDKNWTVLQISGMGWHALNTAAGSDFLLKEMDASTDSGSVERLIVIAQADSASTGLEFSSSPVVIYYSNSFNGAARLQSEDRAYSNNMDKTRGLEIRDYIHLPSDLLVRENLLRKKTLQSITLGELKARINILEDL
jgi:SNF2 family DNA or RNA helicase